MAKADVKQEVFNPDNVMLSRTKDGELIKKYQDIILKKTVEQSIIPSIATMKPMDKQEVTFSAFLGGIGSFWVGEGKKIQTSKPEWKQLTMKAHKIAVILLASKEYLDFTDSEFFSRMTPEVAKAFAQKIDQAIIANEDNPFAWSLKEAYADGDKVIKGDITAENIHKIQGIVEDNDFDVSDFISTRKNRSALRAANEVIGNETIRLFDQDGKKLDGSYLHETKVIPQGTLIALDRENLFYGVPRNMEMDITTTGQISTVKNEDGSSVNLFEQGLIAARYTMDFGFMMTTNDGVAAIEKGADAPK
ncbi:major capsid protein [Weissella phage PWc]|nr:major capsid protein [Weissella phage PWc]